MDDFELHTLVQDIRLNTLALDQAGDLADKLQMLHTIPLRRIAFTDRVAIHFNILKYVSSRTTSAYRTEVSEWLLPWNRVGGPKRG